MKHTSTSIIRVATFEENQFKEETLNSIKKTAANQEQGIIFANQLCPLEHDAEHDIQDTESWQQLFELKNYLREKGFNAFKLGGTSC